MAIAPKKFSALTALTGYLISTTAIPGVSGGGPSSIKISAAQLKGGYQAIATDAIATLTVGTDAENIQHTGTLTANRAITLSTTDAFAGARFMITRTGGGAFTLDVGTGPLKSLATDTWAIFVYDGSAWYLAAYGAL
jgi:hypothetical protein